MNEQGVLATLARVGAITTESHVIYTSGRHGSTYINKDKVYPHTEVLSTLCFALAQRFSVSDVPEVVIAPAMGGVLLSSYTAGHLSKMTGQNVLSIFAEKSEDEDGKNFVVRREYDQLLPGRRVLVVEDILNTGDSARKVVNIARFLGGSIVGLGALCNRGEVLARDVGVRKIDALLNIRMEAWAEEDCPLCKSGVPINTSVGKGQEFLSKKRVV